MSPSKSPFDAARRLGRGLARNGQARRMLLVEAAARLMLARAQLRFTPFQRLAERMGEVLAPSDPRAASAGAATSRDEAHLAGEIQWAIDRAARHAPFQALCLPQAMAARRMLAKRGVASVLWYGVAAGERGLKAHAWLTAAGVGVTGYPVASDYTEIVCFVWPRRNDRQTQSGARNGA